MTIVHCFFTMETGGSQLLAVDLLNEMCQAHQTALVIVNEPRDVLPLRQLDRRVAVYFMNRRESSLNPLPILRLNALLAQLKPDVIHCHERKLGQLIRYQRAKIMYTVHDVGIPTTNFRQYDALIAISDAVARDVQQRSGLSAAVVTNGTPMHQFRVRSSYAVSDDTPIRLVQVSRLVHEKKGQDILLRAVADLVHRSQLNVTLDFIGDGPSAGYLRELTRSLAIETVVSFQGGVARNWITAHLADYHAVVQPSRYEGFGLTVVEGIAAGLPVVASDVDGPAEILRGLSAGLLFAAGNVAQCATALATVVAAYRTGRVAGWVHESRPLIEARFSIRTTADGYLTAYQRLIQPVNEPVRVGKLVSG